MLSNTVNLFKALLAILLPSARGNASVFKVVKLIVGLLKAAGKSPRTNRLSSAPKAGPATAYVASLSLAQTDGDHVPASLAHAIDEDSDIDVSLTEANEDALPGFGQLSTMSAHWDLASMAKDDEEEDDDEAHTIADFHSSDKAVSDHAMSAIPEADSEAENTEGSEESDVKKVKYIDLAFPRRRRLDVIEEVDEEEYDEDFITPGTPAGGFEECTESLHGQLASASAHWDLASLLHGDEEEEPPVESHVAAEVPVSPAPPSSRRLSAIMEADEEAELDDDQPVHTIQAARAEEYDDALDAPIPSVITTTPSLKTIAPRATHDGEESTVADMSGLVPSTDPPCSPSLSECSSVDSPMLLTPSTDVFKFDQFRFPTTVSSSPRMDDGFPTADCLFEGIPKSVSFSMLIASPSSIEQSSTPSEAPVIRTADCLFEGIPSLGSYETLYLRSSASPVLEITAPSTSMLSTVNILTLYEPSVPALSEALAIASSTASGGGYLPDGLFIGWLALWLRISVFLSFILSFFS